MLLSKKFTLVLKIYCLKCTGNENYDWDAFENNAEYRGGYTSSDPTIRMFWEVFHELSLDDKKKFLTFLTGTDRIPIQGMKAIKVSRKHKTSFR